MIALLGPHGQLGTAFSRLLGGKVLAVPRTDLDLEDTDSIPEWVERNRPTMILNCAAYTAVDAAEEDRETARLVNAVAVGALAEAAARADIGLVTFSTDYVFDGSKAGGYVESDPTGPLNVYGRTKLEGERLALATHPRVLVVRTSWLLSSTHPNFLSSILSRLPQGELRVVADQRGSPTFTDDLAGATLRAVESRASGVLHLSNRGETSWYELARRVASSGGYDQEKVIPITSSELGRPAIRPRNSILASERLEALGIGPLPHFEESLDRVVMSLQTVSQVRKPDPTER